MTGNYEYEVTVCGIPFIGKAECSLPEPDVGWKGGCEFLGSVHIVGTNYDLSGVLNDRLLDLLEEAVGNAYLASG